MIIPIMDESSSNGLLTPPTSAASPTASQLNVPHGGPSLPIARRNPLKPGSPKEIALINYVDERVLRITGRYAKKFSDERPNTSNDAGYTTFEQVVRDIDPILDVVWISGTPILQIPYFLSLAGLVCSYMPAFTFSTSLFYITTKLDQAFSTILQASNGPQTNMTNHASVTMTDKVRIKSLIEDTRVVAVQTASSSGHTASVQDLSLDDDTDSEEDESISDGDDHYNNDDIPMGLSRIYKRTLEILGDSLT